MKRNTGILEYWKFDYPRGQGTLTWLYNQGFTLVEVLIALAISGVLFSGIYYAYSSQQKSSIIQQEVSAMQRNLRSGMHFMEREIRMACCDPTGKAGAAFISARKNQDYLDGNFILRFTADIRGDNDGSPPDGDTSDPNEDIGYSLTDHGSDGDTDLVRNGALIAENIDALDFVYLDKSDVPLNDDGNGNVTAQDSLALITSIQITMVARTGLEDPSYTHDEIYRNQQGAIIFSLASDGIDNDGDGSVDEAGEVDHFRRRLITTNIKCRNPER
jgi:type IV pilus assembly protein PilW